MTHYSSSQCAHVKTFNHDHIRRLLAVFGGADNRLVFIQTLRPMRTFHSLLRLWERRAVVRHTRLRWIRAEHRSLPRQLRRSLNASQNGVLHSFQQGFQYVYIIYFSPPRNCFFKRRCSDSAFKT